ncbi:MAG: 50S ribosomal protein L7 [Oscillospiraceae bacterium]|nr:50S ribosomal protein L7 [Oscillospiraceae bacterium]
MSNDVLLMTGMALRAGRLEVGDEAAGDACQYKRCRLLLLAADAGEGAQRRASHFAEEGQCLLAELPCSKEELGAALGRKSCAMAAVTDLGLARTIVQKLAQAEPEKYAEMADRLRLKAERAAQRREKTSKQRQQRGGAKRPPVKYRKK